MQQGDISIVPLKVSEKLRKKEGKKTQGNKMLKKCRTLTETMKETVDVIIRILITGKSYHRCLLVRYQGLLDRKKKKS